MKLTKFLIALLLLTAGYFMICPIAAYAQTTSSKTVPGDIEVEPIGGPTLDKKITSHAKASWPRYVARDAGLIAADLLVLLILSGIGLVTGLTFKFVQPLTAWAVHKAMGLAFAAAVVIHIAVLLFDHLKPYKLLGLLIPFVSSDKSLYLAFGVLAFYGILAITLTSLVWKDKKPHTWKLFHLFSYLVMTLVFFHALYMGTDLSHGITRSLWKLAGLIILALGLGRLRRTHTL